MAVKSAVLQGRLDSQMDRDLRRRRLAQFSCIRKHYRGNEYGGPTLSFRRAAFRLPAVRLDYAPGWSGRGPSLKRTYKRRSGPHTRTRVVVADMQFFAANPEIGVSAKAASSMNMRLSTCSFAPNEVRQSDSEPRPDKLSRAKSTRR